MQNGIRRPERYTKFIDFREALYLQYRHFGSRCTVIEPSNPKYKTVNFSVRRYRNLVYWFSLHFRSCMAAYAHEENQLCMLTDARLTCLKNHLEEPFRDNNAVLVYLKECKLAWPTIKYDAANLLNILEDDDLNREEKLMQFNDYYKKMLPPELTVIKDLLDEVFSFYRMELMDETTGRKRKNMLLDKLKFFDLDMYERKCFSITGRSQNLISRLIRGWNSPSYDNYSFRFFLHKILRTPEPYFESPYMIPDFPHRCLREIPKVDADGRRTIRTYVVENEDSPDEDESAYDQLI